MIRSKKLIPLPRIHRVMTITRQVLCSSRAEMAQSHVEYKAAIGSFDHTHVIYFQV